MLTKIWHARFFRLSVEISKWSKDHTTCVGCVIVNKQRQIVATGYNGFPRGVTDSYERLSKRETKHLFTVHAEANAIASAARQGNSVFECTAFISRPPCAQCGALLCQAGISEVHWLDIPLHESWSESTTVAKYIFSEAGIVHTAHRHSELFVEAELTPSANMIKDLETQT